MQEVFALPCVRVVSLHTHRNPSCLSHTSHVISPNHSGGPFSVTVLTVWRCFKFNGKATMITVTLQTTLHCSHWINDLVVDG